MKMGQSIYKASLTSPTPVRLGSSSNGTSDYTLKEPATFTCPLNIVPILKSAAGGCGHPDFVAQTKNLNLSKKINFTTGKGTSSQSWATNPTNERSSGTATQKEDAEKPNSADIF